MSWLEATKTEIGKTLTNDYMSSEEELEYPPSPHKNAGYVRGIRKLYWKSE